MSGAGRAPSEAEYLAAIEERFRRLRERPLLLSPNDTRQALAWHRDGVPLDVVLEMLDELFARAIAAGRRGPRSLGYCDEPVRGAAARRRELLVGVRGGGGGTGAKGREALRALYDRAAARIRDSGAPDDAREEAARRLERLGAGDPEPGVPDPLLEIEERLVDRCLSAAGDEVRGELEAAARAAIAGWVDRMSPEVLARALRRAIARQARSRFDLPDLSRLPLPPPGPGPGGG